MKEYKLSITLGDKAYVCENDANDTDVIIAEFDGHDEAENYIDNNFQKIREGSNYNYYTKLRQYWQWYMVPESGIMHLLTKRRNMSTETLKAIKELYEILKLSKEYVDLLEKRVSILEKQLQEK